MEQESSLRHKIFQKFSDIRVKEAGKYLFNQIKTDQLTADTNKKYTGLLQQGGSVLKTFRRLPLLLQMVRKFNSGEYRAVSKQKILMIIAAILYFFVPMDSIPDFLPFIGLLDDAMVMAFVLRVVQEEIDRFEIWQNENQGN